MSASARQVPRCFRCLIPTALVLSSVAQAQEIDVTRYHRAERLLAWNVNPLISGGAVAPQWMSGGHRFWYRNQTGDGAEFVVVDAERRTRTLLFDHDRLAAAMSLAADTAFEGRKLPFRTFRFGDGEGEIRFNANKRGFHCDIRLPTSARRVTRSPARRPSSVPPTGASRLSCTNTISGCGPPRAATRRN